MIDKRRNELIDSFRTGAFSLDFQNLSFQRDGESFCQGPGYIVRKSATEPFSIHVFAEGPAPFGEFLERINGAVPGRLLGNESMCKLEAIDIEGSKWQVDRLFEPESGGNVKGERHLRTAKCHELTLVEDSLGSNTYAEIYSAHKINFPTNTFSETVYTVAGDHRSTLSERNAAKFSESGFDCEFRTVEDFTVASVLVSDKKVPKLDLRLAEAASFVLGTRDCWDVRRLSNSEHNKTIFRALNHTDGAVGFLKPISFQHFDSTGCIWPLFTVYLAYITQDEHSYMHPVSALMHSVRKSLQGSVEAQALTAVVTVEQLVREYFADVGTRDLSSLEVDSLLEHMNDWAGDEDILKRARNMLGGLKAVRNIDHLYALSNQGRVSESNVKIWKKMRDKAAHGDWSGVQNLQQFVNRIGSVHTLIHELVFDLIDFKGRYTDWGTLGWPEREYPIVQTAD